MGLKELKETGRKKIPYAVRVKIANKKRNFEEACRVKKPYYVEAFNNMDITRDPDYVGVTMYYPNAQNPTHIKTKIFPISVGEKEFTRQMLLAEEEFETKIPAIRDKKPKKKVKRNG